MIYLDTSVVLARLLKEERSPPDAFWSQPLISSRLLEYEVFNRLHLHTTEPTRIETARLLVDRLSFHGMTPKILARALEPFPVAVRTLDSLHLATMVFLRANSQTIRLASYDKRLTAAAAALGFELAAL